MRSDAAILVADGHPTRGERLLAALEAAGLRGRLVPHGAAALEVALSGAPRVLVAPVDLPLVDAAKLAEILRANPRTRRIQLVVLGPDGRRAGWAGVGDEWLEAKAPVEAVVAAVRRVLERQARLDEIASGEEVASPLEGQLQDVRPAELLQLLHARRASGVLTLEGPGNASTAAGRVRYSAGEILAAELGPVRGEKALFRWLDCTEGRFHFVPGAGGGAPEIKAPTRALLAEGLRQQGEWHRIAAKLPPLESPIRLKVARSELPPVLHPLTQEVLGLVEEAGRVGDVIDRCSQPDYQVLRTLQTLAERGILELGRARIAAPDGYGQALFGEAQCRRLRGFVQSERRSGTALPDAKLLIVAASAEATRRFSDLLAKVPGTELARALERGGETVLPLAPLARIAVDGDFAIELIHLPADAAFTPLWSFAAHRALGTVFLLDATMGASASVLADVAAAIGGQPEARTFHVVLLGEGERVSPDELRRNLSLLDSASLFLLPIDPGKDPSSLLRSLFARIVP